MPSGVAPAQPGPPEGEAPIVRVAHPAVSLWQSAVREVTADRVADGDVKSAVVGAQAPVRHADEYARRRNQAAKGDAVSPAGRPRGELGRILRDVRHGLPGVLPETLAGLRSGRAYSERDPGFLLETTLRYIGWYWSGHRPVYRDWKTAGRGDLDFGVVEYRLPDRARIGLISDWGTGMDDARHLLQALLRLDPAVLIHLGDIYYAGTVREDELHFAAVLNAACSELGHRIPVFTIPGNHDYYSGGRGFYGLVDRLNVGAAKQVASYFCLRSEGGAWQFLAMDTGFNDRRPSSRFDPYATAPGLHASEEEWLRHHLRSFGGQTILLSHHPLFSAHRRLNGTRSGAPRPNFNSALFGSVQPYLDRVALWLWGHEHSLGVYQEGLHGVARARLIGCSAFESQTEDDPYQVRYPDTPFREPLVRLSIEHGWYDHGFAVVDLAGTAATAGYYRFPSWSGPAPATPPAPQLLYQEDLGGG